MAESAPLLDQSYNGNDHHIPTSAESARSSSNLKKLKLTALIFSVILLVILIANQIIINNGELGPYGRWDAERATRELAVWAFISVIFLIISIAVALPVLINFIVDVVFASTVLPWAITLLSSLPTLQWCQRFKYPPYPSPPEEIPPNPKCKDATIIIKWVMVVGGALGIIVGVLYVTLAIIRAVAILRSKFWKRSTWTLGNGEITFQISLKIHRQEGTTSVDQGLEDAGSSSGRGPLHL